MDNRTSINSYLDKVYALWLDEAVRLGAIKIPDYEQNKDKYIKPIWIDMGTIVPVNNYKPIEALPEKITFTAESTVFNKQMRNVLLESYCTLLGWRRFFIFDYWTLKLNSKRIKQWLRRLLNYCRT
jgi:hypothetical protein